MTADAWFLGVVLVAALVLFYTQWLRPDLTALLLLMSMVLPWKPGASGLEPLLDANEAFAAFGSPAVIMIVAMFVVSGGMVRTGAADILGRRLLESAAHNDTLLQAAVLGAVTLFSSLVNDTTAVLVWMPVVTSVCRERGLAPSRYLLAVAYGALLGGQWTLIGTRSNILVSDYLAERSGEGMGFFELTPIAFFVSLTCMAFYLLVGTRFLPKTAPDEGLAAAYSVTDFLTEVMITADPKSPARSLDTAQLEANYGVQVLEVIRGDERFPPTPGLGLSQDDVIVVQGESARIAKLLKAPDFGLREELKLQEGTLRSLDLVMVEALIANNSGLIGQPLSEIDFLGDYGLTVLAVSREGRTLEARPTSEVPLRFGDTLLLCGHHERLPRLKGNADLLLLNARPFPVVERWRAFVMLGILVGMAAAVATKILAAAVALPLAALLTIVSGSLRMREAYSSVNWSAVLVVGGVIPYGYALEKTGMAESLAAWLAQQLPVGAPFLTLAILLLLAVFVTQLIENAAVAIVLAPLFYNLALHTGLDPRTVLLGLAITISAGFMSPVGHEGTILVMGPGHYDARHYVRVGAGFAFLTWAVTIVVIAWLKPL